MRRAFTLIELLIVVAIIGILAAIAVPNFLNARVRAKIAKVDSDQNALSKALEMYLLDNNSYPGDHDLDEYTGSQRGLFRLTSPIAYVASLPVDPFVEKTLASTLGFGNSNAYAANGRPDYEMGSGADNGSGQKVQAYSLMSYGPDMVDDNSSHDPFPFGTDMDRYSPTNGIRSSGNIFKFGGNYTAGCIILDWGRDFLGSKCGG
ncbi:MAG TPA: prepilin-type N-terminal cleavage/methylation domain-containing protein [bacterium]|nr:prepilin-type N-terminal cleavage/methylation domain-containing protein [bacterium]HQP98165.1 prepilin-type N-terminal cleavage/methylation domain-containing protein [bacterium]